MEVGILGPLTVTGGGEPVKLIRRKQRLLVAMLALRAGDVVTFPRIVEALWESAPPPTARKQVHVHMSTLRRLLTEAGEDGDALETGPTGYRLRVPPATLDLRLFAQGVAAAEREQAAGRREEASRILRDALALWRGAALDGLGGRLAEGEARRLEEWRLTALERRLDLDLGLGRHAELVPELTGLVDLQPLHEGLRSRLALALQRCGRSGDALAVCREGRRITVAELGIEPAGALRATELAILRGEPAGEPVTPAPVALARPTSHGQLPRAVPDLVGRDAELDHVCALLAAPRSLTALVVTGRPGVGKSSLALHAAHGVRDRYPDGQLYLRLRGADGVPVEAVAVLRSALCALGVDEATVPSDPDALGRRYRELLADRRVLVVLDDAADEAQVRPLLPGCDRCAVLVTSNRWLAGLEGARPVELDVLSSASAVELLRRVLGAGRVDAEAADAERVAALCGYLPLALRIAAARLACRPRSTLGELAARLDPARQRLDGLSAGDLDLRHRLWLGYRGVSVPARRALRLLGLLKSEGFSTATAAAALGCPGAEAERWVEELVDAHLLDVDRTPATGLARYRFHELIRLFAQERSRIEQTPPAWPPVLRRPRTVLLSGAAVSGARGRSPTAEPPHRRP